MLIPFGFLGVAAIPIGQNWETRTFPVSTVNFAFAQGPSGMWLAATGGTTYYTSPNGITWTSRTHANFQPSTGYGIVGRSDRFLRDAGGNSSWSTDGINWTYTSIPTSIFGQIGFVANNRFFLTAGGSGSGYVSDNAVTWTAITGIAINSISRIVFGNSLYIASRDSGSSGTDYSRSSDGQNWTWQSGGVGGGSGIIAAGNGAFINGSWTNAVYRYSTDAINWSNRTGPWGSERPYRLTVFQDGHFVTAPDFTNTPIYFSKNGETWTASTIPYPFGYRRAHSLVGQMVLTPKETSTSYFVSKAG